MEKPTIKSKDTAVIVTMNPESTLSSRDYHHLPIYSAIELDRFKADIVFCFFDDGAEVMNLIKEIRKRDIKKLVLVSQVRADEIGKLMTVLAQDIEGMLLVDDFKSHYKRIINMLQNEQYVFSHVFQRMMAEMIAKWRNVPKKLSHFELDEMAIGGLINNTEKRVLDYLGHGYNTKAIADRMNYAESTIHIAAAAIIKALKAESRTDAVVKAIRLGYLVPYMGEKEMPED